MNVQRSLVLSVGVIALLTTLQQKANAGHIETMTIDEILYQDNNPVTVALDAEVRMRVTGGGVDWFLEIELTNKTVDTGAQDPFAGVVLTGVGFNLPTPISFVDVGTDPGDDTVHNISLWNLEGLEDQLSPSAVETTIVGSGGPGTNDNWAFGDASGGHFNSPATLSYSNVITTFGADATGTTLAGNVADGSATGNIDQFDYGIISKDAGTAASNKEPWYDNFLAFRLKLDFGEFFDFGSWTGDDLLADIQNGPVGVTFGSPKQSNLDIPFPPVVAVPEPASMAMMGLGGLLVGGALVRRRKRKKS